MAICNFNGWPLFGCYFRPIQIKNKEQLQASYSPAFVFVFEIELAPLAPLVLFLVHDSGRTVLLLVLLNGCIFVCQIEEIQKHINLSLC